ncbi:MAG: hypothetical protein R6X32_16920 [Chloroflexota bacterium]
MNLALGPKQYGIIVLALITAVIHLFLGIQYNDVLFLLNGIGYIGLLGMLYLPLAFLSDYREYVRWALIGYAALTIVLYFVMQGDPFGSAFGLVTKAVEVGLIVLLLLDRP